jgi:hypothetical protein
MNIPIASAKNSESLIAGLKVGPDPAVVVFFSSPAQPLADVGNALQASFPGAAVLGCTTAGEIVSGCMQSGSMVAMALPHETVSGAAVAVVEDLKNPAAVSAAWKSLCERMGAPLDLASHVGLILVDGLSGAEEAIIEQLGDLTDIPFVGGSAGDDLAFRATLVSANGRAYGHAAVLALLRAPNGYQIIKTQSFRALGKTLTATSVDESTRTVRQFNGLPAARAYAEALGIDASGVAARFMRNPLGLMVGDEPFVRSPQRVLEDGSIVFYCQIREDMELDLLESTDIIADTRKALSGEPRRALLVFNCILRTLDLQQQGRCEAYGALFAGTPSVGFSTYGKAYMGHINQTATMLAFR